MHLLTQFIKKTPSVFLVFFAYLLIFCVLLSYDHAWMHPEQFWIKSQILDHGTKPDIHDIKLGLNWNIFEYEERSSRPLSSYFEILDTKFRVWLWQYLPPHPSLSLTWIFSLILSPIFLFLLLKNLNINTNTALAAIAIYLLTPGFLSFVVMLFRPAKAMTNFSIILCLFIASELNKRYNAYDNKNTPPSFLRYSCFLLLVLLSFFWDETALLIYPSIILFFPKLLSNKMRAAAFLFIPLFALFAYKIIIPTAINYAGYPIGIQKYAKLQNMFHPRTIESFIQWFPKNSALLLFDTLGIVRVSSNSSFTANLLSVLNCLCLIILTVLLCRSFYHQRKTLHAKKLSLKLFLWIGGFVSLLLFHNSLMSFSNIVWGPFWYGAYWSIYFVIFSALLFSLARVNKIIIVLCLLPVQLNLAGVFIETNKIYKRFHYYPYYSSKVSFLFADHVHRYDPEIKPLFSGEALQKEALRIWKWKRNQEPLQSNSIPKELKGILIELDPDKYHHDHPFINNNSFFVNL